MPFEKSLGKSIINDNNVDYHIIDQSSQTIESRRFEGLKLGYGYSKKELDTLATINKWNTLDKLSPGAKKRWMTFMLYRPIKYLMEFQSHELEISPPF